MSTGTRDDATQLREIEQLWAALWLSAELRDARERDLRIGVAERA